MRMNRTHEEEQSEYEAVKVGREQAEVVVRGRRHAVQDRRDGVEDEHRRRVRDEEPDWFGVFDVSHRRTVRVWLHARAARLTRSPVPARGGHVVVLQPGGLDAVDEHAPHAELSDDLVQGGLAHEELFGRVCYGVVSDISFTAEGREGTY